MAQPIGVTSVMAVLDPRIEAALREFQSGATCRSGRSCPTCTRSSAT
jgi:hypothetical protein